MYAIYDATTIYHSIKIISSNDYVLRLTKDGKLDSSFHGFKTKREAFQVLKKYYKVKKPKPIRPNEPELAKIFIQFDSIERK